METRTYIVTLQKGATKSEILEVLSRDTTADDAVNSKEIPDRPIAITPAQEFKGSQRIFKIDLTSEEYQIVKNNPNVFGITFAIPKEETAEWDDAVQSVKIKRFEINEGADLYGSSPYARVGDGSDLDLGNWGLIRHTNWKNPFNFTHNTTPTDFDYEYYYTGEGVDYICQEYGHPAPNLSEWQDPDTGVNRFQLYAWEDLFTNEEWSGGGVPYYNQTLGLKPPYQTDHATQTTAIGVGKNLGWAKKALIYACPTGFFGYELSFEAIKRFHQKKIDDAAGGPVRPTVVNASWGQKAVIDVVYTDVGPGTLPNSDGRGQSVGDKSIMSVYFRGTHYTHKSDLTSNATPTDEPGGWFHHSGAHTAHGTSNTMVNTHIVSPIKKFGIMPSDRFSPSSAPRPYKYHRVNVWSADQQAFVEELTDIGVHYVKSAGNESQKLANPYYHSMTNYVNYTDSKILSASSDGESVPESHSNVRAINFHGYSSTSDPPRNTGKSYTSDYANQDYNNYLTLNVDEAGIPAGEPILYNRGAGNISDDTIVVGDMDAYVAENGWWRDVERLSSPDSDGRQDVEGVASYSERGPRVDTFAAGNRVHVVFPLTGDSEAVVYKNSGTSFSTPQVAGMLALVLEKYPTTKPWQGRKFFRDIARSSTLLRDITRLEKTETYLYQLSASNVSWFDNYWIKDNSTFGHIESFYGVPNAPALRRHLDAWGDPWHFARPLREFGGMASDWTGMNQAYSATSYDGTNPGDTHNLNGAIGNIAYLNPTLPFNPSTLTGPMSPPMSRGAAPSTNIQRFWKTQQPGFTPPESVWPG